MGLSERDGCWRWPIWALVAAAVLALVAASPASAARHHSKSVKVMTRNLYLGVNLKPALGITSLQGLADFAGKAFRQEQANNFRTRSKGLAREILKKKPDLVGLQEGATYRNAPCDVSPIPPTATHVLPNGDHLELLMQRLNAHGRHYRVVVTQPEFDFQIWANTDHNASTGSPFGCDEEIRLTFSDAILARVHAGVKTTNARHGHFDTLLQVQPAGVPINVERGWTRIDAKVRGGRRFRLVDTHLEAYDDTSSNHTNRGSDVGKGRIRKAQAKELVSRRGPADPHAKLPVILLGDLNSDNDTVRDGDRLAYRVIRKAGYVERSTANPLSCCLDTSILTANHGSVADFDHQVDHILADRPRLVKLVSSSVTGRSPRHGFWDSDHAGLFSKLRIR